MAIERIVITGAGTMGANIALEFAVHGREVTLCDAKPEALERAGERMLASAQVLQRHGLLNAEPAAVVRRVVCTPDPVHALAAAELVIEAVPEDLALKHRVLRELEAACSEQTILASNTSTFMPSKLAVSLRLPRRLLVAHYWNPAHLVPLVELVPHAQTAPETLAAMHELLETCGKRPIVVKKEVPGFIGNRLAFALQREAMALVAQGVATPDDIDTVVRTGFGRRIPVTGIFGTADLGGLDVYAAICDVLFPELCADRAAPELLRQRVAAGKLGVKTGAGWREYPPTAQAAMRAALEEELLRQAQRDRETG